MANPAQLVRHKLLNTFFLPPFGSRCLHSDCSDFYHIPYRLFTALYLLFYSTNLSEYPIDPQYSAEFAGFV